MNLFFDSILFLTKKLPILNCNSNCQMSMPYNKYLLLKSSKHHHHEHFLKNLVASQESAQSHTPIKQNAAIYATSNSKPHTAAPSQTPFPRSFLQTLVEIPRMLSISAIQPEPHRRRGPLAQGGAAVVEGGAPVAAGGVPVERRAPSSVARDKQP